MSDSRYAERANTSFYKDFFEMTFEATDMMSVWWQPVFKGVGRTHLEIAGLQSKNTQSMMQWGRAIATARQPGDVLIANLEFCRSVLYHCGEAAPRVSGAITTATDPVSAFQVLPLPVKRTRDSLTIEDADSDISPRRDSRVA